MDCLSDLACLEWVRFGETRLAPEASADVQEHLDACADCRRKLNGFEAMERSMHPYGSPPPRDALPSIFRRSVAVVLAGVLVYVCWLVLC